MIKKMTVKEVADLVFRNKDSFIAFDFYESYDEDSDDRGYAHKLTLEQFSYSPTVISNYHGGGALFCYDLADDTDASGLEHTLGSYLKELGIEGGVWVEGLDKFWMLSNIEVGLTRMRNRADEPQPQWWIRSVDPLYKKRPSIIVEVKDGRVDGVYSADPELDIDILDLDTTDIEAEEDLMTRHMEIMEQCEKGELHSIL